MLSLPLMTACMGLNWDVLRSDYQGAPKAIGESEYIIDFKRDSVNRVGVERSAAVILYLQEKKLIPLQCSQGVTYVRGGSGENGYGWAIFRCAKGIER